MIWKLARGFSFFIPSICNEYSPQTWTFFWTVRHTSNMCCYMQILLSHYMFITILFMKFINFMCDFLLMVFFFTFLFCRSILHIHMLCHSKCFEPFQWNTKQSIQYRLMYRCVNDYFFFRYGIQLLRLPYLICSHSEILIKATYLYGLFCFHFISISIEILNRISWIEYCVCVFNKHPK